MLQNAGKVQMAAGTSEASWQMEEAEEVLEFTRMHKGYFVYTAK